MTAQDLRDEIDRRLEKHTNIILKELKEIKSMLDELEPKATKKWTLTTTKDFCIEQEEDAEYLITIHNKLTDTYYVRECTLNNVGQCYLATKSEFNLQLADNEEIIAYHKREIMEPYLAAVEGGK